MKTSQDGMTANKILKKDKSDCQENITHSPHIQAYVYIAHPYTQETLHCANKAGDISLNDYTSKYESFWHNVSS